jgi:hypothetical protein
MKISILHFSLNYQKIVTHPDTQRLSLPTLRAPFIKFLSGIRPYLKQERIIFKNLKTFCLHTKTGVSIPTKLDDREN